MVHVLIFMTKLNPFQKCFFYQSNDYRLRTWYSLKVLKWHCMLYHLYRVCLFDKVCMTRSWQPYVKCLNKLYMHIYYMYNTIKIIITLEIFNNRECIFVQKSIPCIVSLWHKPKADKTRECIKLKIKIEVGTIYLMLK